MKSFVAMMPPRFSFAAGRRRFAVTILLGAVSPYVVGAAADPRSPLPASTLQEITVIGITPVPGLTIDIDKVPGNVQSVLAGDLAENGTASLTGALGNHLGSVSISDTLADPFQPDVLYRGFEASPVLGTPQGLAVYQNGVRINEAFGDSVNWDLIPDLAINRIDIVSSSPLYGLNALGGAMSVTMKNGFTSRGTDGTISGGSFNQRAASAETGFNRGIVGLYAAFRALAQDGWRRNAHDVVRQYYADLSVRHAGVDADLSYSRADNRLFGPGAAPVQSLALDPTAVFTGPQASINEVDFVTLNVANRVDDHLAVQSNAYYRSYRQSVSNGNGSNIAACSTAAQAGFLCQPDGRTPLVDAAGTPLPDVSNRGMSTLGQNNFESVRSQTWGGSLQISDTRPLGGGDNQAALGTAVDASHTGFRSGTQIGILDASLIVEPSPLVVDTPEGTPFPATPVVLSADARYYGFYATDTLDATSRLAVTVSARYNVARITLADQRGVALTGNSRFAHLNPAAGATYKAFSAATLFIGYSVNNRTPTASEIECSDPRQPCLLPSSLAGDPPNLRQVIARTVETGLRGHPSSAADPPLTWNISIFRTDLRDDIYGIATSVSTGFFQNIGATQRQGLEAGAHYQGLHWSAFGAYSYVAATFRSTLTLSSPSNPFRDANGEIRVAPGDQLPGIPRQRLKLGIDLTPSPAWTVGASFLGVGNQVYHGDESNRNPRLPGYVTLGLRVTRRLRDDLDLFAAVDNVFDRRYATYGLFGDPTGVGAPGIPANAGSNDPRVDNRFQNPAAPRSAFGGIKVRF